MSLKCDSGGKFFFSIFNRELSARIQCGHNLCRINFRSTSELNGVSARNDARAHRGFARDDCGRRNFRWFKRIDQTTRVMPRRLWREACPQALAFSSKYFQLHAAVHMAAF